MRAYARAPLLGKALHDLRSHVAGYGGGLALTAALYTLLFPAMGETIADIELPAAYEAFLGTAELGTARGFLQVEFFSFWLPLLIAIYAIITATGQLAGEEGEGTLEMTLAQPVSRRRVLLERFVALTIGVALICTGASLGFAVALPLIDAGDLTLLEVLIAPFAMVPFGVALIALGLFAGTVAPTRGQASAVVAAFVVAAYVADVVPDLATKLDALRYTSLFYYADAKHVLIDGVVPWRIAVELAAAGVLLLLAIAGFEGREIGIRNWQPRALLGRRRASELPG